MFFPLLFVTPLTVSVFFLLSHRILTGCHSLPFARLELREMMRGGENALENALEDRKQAICSVLLSVLLAASRKVKHEKINKFLWERNANAANALSTVLYDVFVGENYSLLE